MKRFLRIALVLLVLLLIVLVVNTLRFTSRQLADVAPAAPVTIPDSAVTRLAESIRYRTVSFTDYALTDTTQFDKFLAFIKRAYPLVHSRMTLERINNYGLLYKLKGKNPALKPMLLMGHYDVVPVIQGTQRMWKHQPFAGDIADGFVYGRGTLDDKSTVIGVLESVEMLLETGFQPERTLLLAFGQDEETLGIRGGKSIAQRLAQRKVALEYVMDEGGTVKTDGISGLARPIALVGISEKGFLSLQLTAIADGGHSSMPPKQTSIGMLATAIDRLQNAPFSNNFNAGAKQLFSYIGPEMGFGQKLVFANSWLFSPLIERLMSQSNSGSAMLHTTIAPTIFQAGVKDNVLPIDASATINFRILPGETVQSVTDHVKEVIANDRIKIQPLSNRTDPSPLSDTESASFNTINRTIRSIFPDAIVSPYLVVGGTDSRHYQGICQNVYRFAANRMNDEDLKRVHGTNERISTADYQTMIRFYVTLIRNSQ